ncbi:MAG: hypothetical protein JXA15_07210 [Spirochaetales bacterium]|nr:hypothetical protein [Spirochaetales bacterium]
MRHFGVTALLCLLVSGLCPPAARADEAWDRAVSDYARGLSLQARRVSWRIEELDGDGAVSSWEEVDTRVDWSGGTARSTVVSASKNGEDVTETWRKRLEKSGSGDGPPAWGEGFSATPFDPGFQEGRIVSAPYQAVDVGATRLFTPYELSGDGKTRVKGLLVADESGQPLYARQTWVQLPMAVSGMEAIIRYARGPGGELVIASLEYRADASILFVRKRFRFVMRFGDWA